MAAPLTTQVGENRSVARILHEDYDDLHKKIHDVEWRAAA